MRVLPNPRNWLRSTLGWLKPGLGVKRWLGLLLLGTMLLGLGFSFLLVDLVKLNVASSLLSILTLHFLPRLARVLVLGAVGLAMMLFAVARLNRAVLAPYVRPGRPVVEEVARHRRMGRGPRVVAIGGGTGLSTFLRGLKTYTSNITAIVTVADDGGSSGRLRRSLGVLPPGDFRNCIAALADDEALTTQLFQYRFAEGDGIDGHSFGNLFITAMSAVTGSFERALLESSRVLAIEGRVVPSTLADVTLVADVVEAEMAEASSRVSRIEGETQISREDTVIRRLYLKPSDPPAYPEAVQALLAADLIVAGPGSLFTSVLPNLLVPDLAEAVRASRALKVYVCNVATQPGETTGFAVGDHLDALERHTSSGLFPVVLANSFQPLDRSPEADWVRLEWKPRPTLEVITADLADEERPWRHDPRKLAKAVMELLENRRNSLNGQNGLNRPNGRSGHSDHSGH